MSGGIGIACLAVFSPAIATLALARLFAINPREIELDQLQAGYAYPDIFRRVSKTGAIHYIHIGGNAS